MNLLALLFIPTFAAMVWALYTKYEQRKMSDLMLMVLNAVAIIVNAVLVYQMVVTNISVECHLMQMISGALIIPLEYIYFARQMGQQVVNRATVTLLWGLVLLVLVPNVIIYNPFAPFELPQYHLKPFVLYVFSDGAKLFAIYMGDLIIILQCLVVLLRIIPFMLTLRQHKLRLDTKVYFLCVSWAFSLVFACLVSGMDYEELRSTGGTWFYFGGYSLTLMIINLLIVKGYDLYPVKTDEGEVVEDLEVYVQHQYADMAMQLRELMTTQRLYLNPQLSAEQVVESLHTNHTYFSQMMSEEWKMSFTDYVISLRLSHAELLLKDSSLSIAEVATQSGFLDYRYMSRKFKARHGITPSEWRKL